MRRVVVLLLVACGAAACADASPSATGEVTTGTASATTTAADTTDTAAADVPEPSAAPTTTLPPTTTTTVPLWAQYPTYEVAPTIGPRQVKSVSRVDTTDPVVFLTIDDGFERDQRVVDLLRARGAVATLFVLPGPLRQDPAYFAQFVELGGTINSHTARHVKLDGLPQDQQAAEICAGADAIASLYGYHGPWMRPPYGAYDRTTFEATGDCGLSAVMMWRVTASEGIISTWGDAPINPGDIILMHFRPTLYEDLLMVFAELDRLGLHIARIEDYLKVG